MHFNVFNIVEGILLYWFYSLYFEASKREKYKHIYIVK